MVELKLESSKRWRLCVHRGELEWELLALFVYFVEAIFVSTKAPGPVASTSLY